MKGAVLGSVSYTYEDANPHSIPTGLLCLSLVSEEDTEDKVTCLRTPN